MSLNERQKGHGVAPAYSPYLNDDTPTQIFFGEACSGKSVFVAAQRPIRDLLNKGRNCLIVRNAIAQCCHSVFDNVRKSLVDQQIQGRFTVNEGRMSVVGRENGRQMHFVGLDDIEKIKTLPLETGFPVDIIIDEAAETSKLDVERLQRAVWQKGKRNKGRLILIFNPDLVHPIKNWIFISYFSGKLQGLSKERGRGSLLIVRTMCKDNEILTEDISF